jgi:hypothetical protein
MAERCYCCGGSVPASRQKVEVLWRRFCEWKCWRQHRDGMCDCAPEKHDERVERLREVCE